MTTNPIRPRVLVVDDEAGMRELLEIVLGNEGYDVKTAGDVTSAQNVLQEQHFDCLITDLRFGAQRDAGLKLLRWTREHEPSIPVVMITAYGSVETAIEALKEGATDYILKPFKNDEIRLVVRKAIEQRNLIRENTALRKDQALRGKLENIIGKSRAIEEVRDMIRRVATVPSTVAIHGESGTGKELVARAIHALSERAEKPFVAVNCGAFPENLLESELFGYKKGAFTGATEDKDGLFVAANGGTLFLDEIGEMPVNLQVKLLRVLDNGLILPVGGTVPIPVSVRIISATNRNLEEMVRNNQFREDLFYRLNVIPIVVPPLRERAEDIPLLVRHFISQHATKMNRAPLTIAAEAEDALRTFHWPGNVRELENVMERAVALCRGSQIELADLPTYIQHYVATPSDVIHDLPEEGLDLEAYVADLETRLIKQALERTRYSQKKAAELLHLSPRSFRYRLQKYGLEK